MGQASVLGEAVGGGGRGDRMGGPLFPHQLPRDVLDEVLRRGPGRDAKAARRVCRAWRTAMLEVGVLLVDVTSSVERLRRARAQGWVSWGPELCAGAARMGRLAVLQEARRLRCPWNEGTCAGAAEGGHLAVLAWARANGCPWDKTVWLGAAGGGHNEVLEWAEARGCPRVLEIIPWVGPGSIILWNRQPRVLDIVPWEPPGSLVLCNTLVPWEAPGEAPAGAPRACRGFRAGRRPSALRLRRLALPAPSPP